MTFFFLLTTVFFSMELHGQRKIAEFKNFPKEILEQMDSMGIDGSPILTQIEGLYFNILFQKSINYFDFCGKKVAFLEGHTGTMISSKDLYFDRERPHLLMGDSPSFAQQLLIFNDVQKKETGGYDAVIVLWSKKRVTIESAVKTLKKNL